MLLNQKTNNNCTARQLKLPLEIEKIIDISDPVVDLQLKLNSD